LSDFVPRGCLLGEIQNKSDAQLLGEYAAQGCETAFAEIVARHTDLVYSAAWRQTGSSEMGREIAQSVFSDLARKARTMTCTLSSDASLAGWLFRSTRYAGLKLLRDDHRRQNRERQFMEHFNPAPQAASGSASDWERIAPVLDEAMAELGDGDHEAVLLRYFKNQDFHAVGLALGVSDAAAQKRVSRAVERLRKFFASRGVTVGASGLALVISANAVQAAPSGLAATLSGVSTGLAHSVISSAAATSTPTLVKGTVSVMALTKIKVALIATTVILLGGATAVLIKHQTSSVAVLPQPIPAPTTPAGPTADDGRLGGPRPDWQGAVTRARSAEEKEQIQGIWCVDNLKQVGGAAREWAVAHNNVFPADFVALNQTISPRYLACPADTNKTDATKWAETTTINISYKLISPNSPLDRPNRVIAQCPVHGHVAMSDGSVLQGKIARKLGIIPDNAAP